jgi:hypothetical protein
MAAAMLVQGLHSQGKPSYCWQRSPVLECSCQAAVVKTQKKHIRYSVSVHGCVRAAVQLHTLLLLTHIVHFV